MFTELFQAICQVGTFMICAQAVVHFRPKASYEKYLKLLVSVMILIQIFLPVSHLFSRDIQVDISERVALLEQELEHSIKRIQSSALQSEAILEEMTLEETQKQMQEEKLAGDEVKGIELGNERVKKIEVKVGTAYDTEGCLE